VSTLNLGIVAHVDAGKTSLTERLLHTAGVIDTIGSVDDGSTQTDSLALERQRGITIKSAVVAFTIGDVTVNLIDTPGHPDFIAEVERVLGVLDGAVLVVSAVEGVQAQTRVLMRTLQRLRIPTIIFVNKIDRRGADGERVLRTITDSLTPDAIPMGWASALGTPGAAFTPFDGAGDIAAQSRRALVHPVYFGSAITGAGIDALTSAITSLLPATDVDGPVSGTVFKVERGPAGEKIAYVRMFSGTIHTRDKLRFHDRENKVTAISVFDRGTAVRVPAVPAGRIGKLWGLSDVRIGDAIGTPPSTANQHHFALPTLETIVDANDDGALHTALTQLAEQDPLINLRLDEVRQEIAVSLYGEVQKEVIQATLRDEFGIDVTFRETTTVCIERLVGTGTAVEVIGRGDNPFLATVGLRIEPAPANSGVEFRLGVEVGSMPLALFNAVEDKVKETLRQGENGWQVTDCVVTVSRAGFAPPNTTAADFRMLTPLVVVDALRQAGTVVHEPIHRFHLEFPADTLGALLPLLARLRAIPQAPLPQGNTYVLTGNIPAATVYQLQQQLPGLTRGEGVLECAFDHYRPVRGKPPTRPRSAENPFDRKEYLLHVVRRTQVIGPAAAS
jgi:ribosomal protection tetracycline resistance protein